MYRHSIVTQFQGIRQQAGSLLNAFSITAISPTKRPLDLRSMQSQIKCKNIHLKISGFFDPVFTVERFYRYQGAVYLFSAVFRRFAARLPGRFLIICLPLRLIFSIKPPSWIVIQ